MIKEDRRMMFLRRQRKMGKVPSRTCSIFSIPLGTLVVTAAFRTVDGAVIVVGCIEGCAVHTVTFTVMHLQNS